MDAVEWATAGFMSVAFFWFLGNVYQAFVSFLSSEESDR